MIGLTSLEVGERVAGRRRRREAKETEGGGGRSVNEGTTEARRKWRKKIKKTEGSNQACLFMGSKWEGKKRGQSKGWRVRKREKKRAIL